MAEKSLLDAQLHLLYSLPFPFPTYSDQNIGEDMEEMLQRRKYMPLLVDNHLKRVHWER